MSRDDPSRTDTIAAILHQCPEDAPIQIVSGEGEGPGTVKPYTWKRNARAVILALAKERSHGDRWARIVIKDTSPEAANDAGIDLETGNLTPFITNEEPTT